MRNIAEIIEDDRNGKQLSQTERQIAVAYTQGKYDAVRELKIGNNSNTMEIIDKMRAEITDCLKALEEIEKSELNIYLPNEISDRRLMYQQCLKFIDEYKAETEEQDDTN